MQVEQRASVVCLMPIRISIEICLLRGLLAPSGQGEVSDMVGIASARLLYEPDGFGGFTDYR